MTLLLDHASSDFSVDTATLISPSEWDLSTPAPGELTGEAEPDASTDSTSIPVSVIGSNAAEKAGLRHPDQNEWVCLPLHEPDSAEVTSEYVVFVNHDLRGEIFIYGDGTGETDYIEADNFAVTRLARCLRFWHADYVPTAPPSYYSSPIASREDARNPLSSTSEAFFDALADFIETERETQRQQNIHRCRTASASQIRAEGGDAIPSLISRGHIQDTTYRFEVPETVLSDDRGNRSIQSIFGIYEDNEVLLTAPESAPDTFPVLARVTDITNLHIYLDLKTDAGNTPNVRSYLGHDPDIGIVSVLNPVPFEREAEAISTLRTDSRFGEVLTGAVPLTFTDSAAANSEQCDPQLNQDQGRAVEHALAADQLFCIHGPPGTGKTRTLVEIIRRAILAGREVLVCADSNRAVDNIVAGSSTSADADMRSLHAHAQHGGGEFILRRHNARRSRSELVQEEYANVRKRADVVASTNGSAASLDRMFDMVVIDEATQATLPSTCIPLSKADRAVLAGDHRQLPPYSASEEPPEVTLTTGTGFSLFEHLYAEDGVYEGIGIPLHTQYRMHRDIARFPNQSFYDNLLESGRAIDSLDDHPPIVGYDIGGSETISRNSTANPIEARLVAHLVEEFINSGVDPVEMGVITPYTAQKCEIEDVLDAASVDTAPIKVDTIDAFQGSENGVILISLVRSNPDGHIGFLGRPEDGPRRLNVALTRAQRFCGIIGDWRTLTRERDDHPKCSELYHDLRTHLDDTGRFRHVEPELIP